MIAGSLELQLIADIARLKTDMDKATDIVRGATRLMEDAAQAVKNAFIGMAGALSVAAFAEAVRAALDHADALNKLAQRTGIATEALSQLQFAARQSGVASDEMTQAVKKLNVSISAALAGGRLQAEAFRNLGISLKDTSGNTLTADQALLKIADTFAKSRDGANKTAYAVALMGKAGDELIPLLNGGSAAIQHMMEVADKLGLTISKDFAQKAEEFNTNLTILKASSDKLYISLAGDLIAGLGDIVKKMADAAEQGGKLHAIMVGLDEVGNHLFHWDYNNALKDQAHLTTDLADAKKELDFLNVGWEKMGSLQRAALPEMGDGVAKLTARVKELQDALAKVNEQLANHSGQYNFPNVASAGRGVVNPTLLGPVPAIDKQDLAPIVKGNLNSGANAYDALIKSINEKIKADQQELEQGKAVTAFDQFAIKVKEEEAVLLKRFPGLHQDEIDKLLAKAKALNDNVNIMKAEQQSATNYAKDWEKTEADLTADIVARARERDTVYKSIADNKQVLDDNNALLQKEADLLGASDQARSTGLEYLKIELATKNEIKKLNDDLLLTEEARTKAIEDVKVNEALQKQQVDLRAQIDTWKSIDDAARQAFDNMGQKGTNIFKSLGDALKKYLLDQLYLMTIRPIVIQVAQQLGVGPGGMPGTSVGSMGGSGSSLGPLGNFFTGGTSLANSIGTTYANATGTGLDGFLSTNGAFGTAGSGIAGSIGSAVPYVGALYAASQGKYGSAAGMAIGTMIMPGIGTIIGAILGSLLDGKGGGPKQDGVYGRLNSGIGLGQRSTASDAAAQQSATTIQSTYDSIVSAYGGSGGLQYGLGFSMDPKGTSPSFVDITASRGNQTAYTDLNLNAGRSQQELQDAVTGMTTKAVLAGLQQSDLKGMIGQYLATLGDVTNMSVADATTALNRVQKAMTEKQQLEDQIFQMTASQEDQLTKQRKDELAALDASNQALEQRVFALQDEQAASTSLQQALASAASSAQQWASFIAGINNTVRGYIDKLNATSSGGLSPEQQLSNAKLQFNQQLSLAGAGDQNALSNITNYADQLIQAQQGFSGSGGDTASVIAGVKSKLAGLPQMQSTESLLAQVIQSTSANQVAATKDAGNKIWDGLWGSAGLLAQNFSTLDANTSGLLDFGELKTALGPLASDDTIHALIARVDTNGDGQISKLEAINAAVAEAAAVQTQATQDSASSLASTVKMSTGGLAKSIVDALAPVAGTLQYIAGSHDYTVAGNPLGGSVSGLFAGGGVMTPGGPLPLHSYARGGIASSAQVAIFGEGSMNEAFVPLPDGRRIPVNMGGGLQALVSEVQALRAEVQNLRATVDRGNQITAAGARGTMDRLDDIVDNTGSVAKSAKLKASAARV